MEGLIQHFSQHHDHLLYALAGICLLLELSVLGMSGPLLFIALSCLLTGVLVSLKLIQGWEYEVLSLGLLSVVGAAVLWKPLKRFQNSGSGRDTSSDMIGKDLPVTSAITHNEGCVSYSGIEWQARLDASFSEPIAVAQRARVVAVEGSLLIVMPH
ncbi:MAG TPA: NfeD family protein [Cellvibrio sp.]|nr:NfeD family protein [Cellvibrio sp.]